MPGETALMPEFEGAHRAWHGEAPVSIESSRSPSIPNPPKAKDSVLCMGMDIAWWGGSEKDRASMHDGLAWMLMQNGCRVDGGCDRIHLEGRDPEAKLVLSLVDTVMRRHPSAQVVFAVDAPLQARQRTHLPVRVPTPRPGTVERRACEIFLSQERKRIDQERGGSFDIHPNIQPGAPLAPRVSRFVDGLVARGFALWSPHAQSAPRLLLECFPAETIWAAHVLGRFPPELSAEAIKEYKRSSKQARRRDLAADQVRDMVRRVLLPMGVETGHSDDWSLQVERCLDGMLRESASSGGTGMYRHGKMLDDMVDSILCLATASSHVHGSSHIWFDPSHPDDGHIAGPGRFRPT